MGKEPGVRAGDREPLFMIEDWRVRGGIRAFSSGVGVCRRVGILAIRGAFE